MRDVYVFDTCCLGMHPVVAYIVYYWQLNTMFSVLCMSSNMITICLDLYAYKLGVAWVLTGLENNWLKRNLGYSVIKHMNTPSLTIVLLYLSIINP